jgi:hypothetical protein
MPPLMGLAHRNITSSRPNARSEPPPEVGTERTLEAVGSSARLGQDAAWDYRGNRLQPLKALQHTEWPRWLGARSWRSTARACWGVPARSKRRCPHHLLWGLVKYPCLNSPYVLRFDGLGLSKHFLHVSGQGPINKVTHNDLPRLGR